MRGKVAKLDRKCMANNNIVIGRLEEYVAREKMPVVMRDYYGGIPKTPPALFDYAKKRNKLFMGTGL